MADRRQLVAFVFDQAYRLLLGNDNDNHDDFERIHEFFAGLVREEDVVPNYSDKEFRSHYRLNRDVS